MRQRVKRIRPQLLVIPNHADVVAAFKRACNAPVDLIAIELERNEKATGDVLQLFAYVAGFKGQLCHEMPGEHADPKKLIGAAEVLAQTASMVARRAINGRIRSPIGV